MMERVLPNIIWTKTEYMNIYNYIYCFLYTYWEKRATDGRVVGSAAIIFTMLIHILLIVELTHTIAGIQLFVIKSFGTYGENKTIYFLLGIPFWIISYIYYNRKRTKRLLKVYNKSYSSTGILNSFRVILYVIFPAVLLILLSVLRQNV